MYQFILLIHVFVAVFIVVLVLIQQGKGATMGAAFGSGASQTVFGSRGSGSFLFRITMGCVAVFFVTSITLNYLAVQASKQERVITLPALPSSQQAPATKPAETTPAADTTTSATNGVTTPGQTPVTPGDIPTKK
jgi:preprotein translocase subunit SecG